MTTITYTAPCPTCGRDCEWVGTAHNDGSQQQTTSEALCGCGEVAA